MHSFFNDELPHDSQMEIELLSILLLDSGNSIPSVSSILSPDDFFSSRNKFFYEIITRLYSDGTPPNILSIIDELRRLDQLSDANKEFALSLGDYAFSSAYALPWAKRIKEKADLRNLAFFARRLYLDSIADKDPLETILARFRPVFSDFSFGSFPSSFSRNFYFNTFFDSDLSSISLYSNRKTGFSNIDANQIFSPGLYVLGATPACGKTTFAWQLLEQLASLGEHCIFCSYEMSRLELFSKSIARELFKRDKSSTITAADIRRGASSSTLRSIISDFAADSACLELFELRDESIDDLLRIIRPFCNDKNKSPVVCVDYLQIIPPSNDVKLNSDKARIDDIVHKLKTFQRETNTTFIVISSFNRMNYFQQVSFESFKESGGIEYSSDVVWALQMFVANSIKPGSPLSESRKKFDDAKLRQPRQLHLKCLKNRQGNNYDCFFHYFSAHDFFQPCDIFTDTGGVNNALRFDLG